MKSWHLRITCSFSLTGLSGFLSWERNGRIFIPSKIFKISFVFANQIFRLSKRKTSKFREILSCLQAFLTSPDSQCKQYREIKNKEKNSLRDYKSVFWNLGTTKMAESRIRKVLTLDSIFSLSFKNRFQYFIKVNKSQHEYLEKNSA